MSGFAPAKKYERKLRLALCGPTGAGKTYSALAIATALGGKVALIDTEHKSSSLYADVFAFDKLDLVSFDPRRYIEAIEKAAGYDVLIIDSLSHAWSGTDGALEMVDRAAARSRGNSYVAWRDVTPIHNQLVDALVGAPMHLIVTMRSKMAYILEEQTKNGNTVQVPKKVGMEPIQRAGVEYEFDIVGDMDIEHTLVVTKSRLASIDGKVVNKPGSKFGELIVKDLAGESEPAATEPDPQPAENGVESTSGAAPSPPARKTASKSANGSINWSSFWGSCKAMHFDNAKVHEIAGVTELKDWSADELAKLIKHLRKIADGEEVGAFARE